MTTVAFIFARGGSKGLPRKNILLLNGKPLIAWAIEQAKAVQRINQIIVSTDSEEIALIARQYGAEVPFIRPAALARDETPEWLAWRHALNYFRESTGNLPKIMVSIPATAPLRLPIDIDNCLDEFQRNKADCVITVTDANRSPFFNMVKQNEAGVVELVNPPSSNIARRQDAPIVYDMATVCYVLNPEFVMENNSIFDGVVRMVKIPADRAIDIDTFLDFKIAESILSWRSR